MSVLIARQSISLNLMGLRERSIQTVEEQRRALPQKAEAVNLGGLVVPA